jgi:hypothetical protein
VSHSIEAKKGNKGRPMGGIVVCVKRSLERFVARLNVNALHTVFLRISKLLFGFEKDILLACTYIPPPDSPFFRNLDCSGIELLEDYLTLLGLPLDDVYLVFMGDFNARTGNQPDYVVHDDLIANDYVIDSFERARVSQDLTINPCGRELLAFCKNYEVHFLNGRVGKDAGIGDFTFWGNNGRSVIDYYIFASRLFVNVLAFEILNRTESSHMPLGCSIECQGQINEYDNLDSQVNCGNDFRFVWCDNLEESYMKEIGSETTVVSLQNVLLNLGEVGIIEDETIHVDTAIRNFTDILYKAGECLKRRTRANSKNQSRKQKNLWFDNECRLYKNRCVKALRKFRINRLEADFQAYRRVRAQYSQLCKSKKRKWQASNAEKLHESLNDQKLFWNLLKGTKRVEPKISVDKWYRTEN